MTSAHRVPEFILDLGVNRETKPLEWTIRRWNDVEAEVKQAGGYGIISYAWGKWHDKSQFVLGGTKGNVNPNHYPTFDIGVSTKDSVNGADLYNATTNTVNDFTPRTGAAGVTGIRNIPKGTPLSWIFPKVCPMNVDGSISDPKQEVFSIDKIHFALLQMKTRFVWWDWACFPQGWDSDRRIKPAAIRGPSFQVHNELKDIAVSTFNTMRFFYPGSTTGCMWWHETTWSKGPNPGPVGHVENLVKTMASLKSSKDLTSVMVKNIVDSLTNASRTESSLKSLWSFQEAVLFSSSARPAALELILDSQGHGSPSVVLDSAGAAYVVGTVADPRKVFFQHGQLNLDDIVSLVTFVATLIASSLIKQGSLLPSSTHSELVNWCLNDVNESTARGLLSQLLNTGFVGLRFDNPLLLLEARFGREIRSFQDPMDVSVNTIMGAVSVDLSAAQIMTAALVLGKSEADTAALTLTTMKRAFVEGLFALYQWRMLLFARGPNPVIVAPDPATSIWEQLAGTTRSNTAALTPYTDSDGSFSLSFGPNIGSGKKHSSIFDNLPKLQLGDGDSKSLLTCALLGNYPVSDYAMTGITPAPVLVAWTGCVFYSYVSTELAWLPAVATPPVVAPAPGKPQLPAAKITPAGTVRAVSVAFGERVAKLGPDILLFPFQNVDRPVSLSAAEAGTEAIPWVRCFVMARLDPTKPNALTYRGVGDFAGISDSFVKPKKTVTIA